MRATMTLMYAGAVSTHAAGRCARGPLIRYAMAEHTPHMRFRMGGKNFFSRERSAEPARWLANSAVLAAYFQYICTRILHAYQSLLGARQRFQNKQYQNFRHSMPRQRFTIRHAAGDDRARSEVPPAAMRAATGEGHTAALISAASSPPFDYQLSSPIFPWPPLSHKKTRTACSYAAQLSSRFLKQRHVGFHFTSIIDAIEMADDAAPSRVYFIMKRWPLEARYSIGAMHDYYGA